MIESLSISRTATYGNEPEVLSGLSKFNFIFGSNGTGKTTISRVIAQTQGHDHCPINWAGGTKLQALVYNRDFVDANFNQSTEIKGVFTLGEENIETLTKISRAKSELETSEKQIKSLRNTLDGNDLNSGKNGELKAIDESLKNKCWVLKQKHDLELKGAFEGCRDSKDKFKKKVLQELESNTAKLVPQTDLEKRAETIFGEAPSREEPIEIINAALLVSYETNPVLSKRVLGKADVDIAGMINKLGNSDWVRQGLRFYEENEGACPFCQQNTNDDFAKNLADYFDEAFEADSKAIADLEVNYKSEAIRLQQEIAEIISKPSQFLNVEKLNLEKQLLDFIIEGNIQELAKKKKEPSQLIELDTIANTITEITTLIDEANVCITQHNTAVDNITQERKTLTAQVWKFVLDELETDLSDYKDKKSNLDSAITSLNTQISDKTIEINQKALEISKLEKQITSIKPTIDDINALLKDFGFHAFSLAPAEGGPYYKLIRTDGSDAKATLSEGEHSFVTFLYFYHLLKGSHAESSTTDNRVVVFDDPVSSLDSDILFIVSSLIRKLFDEVRSGKGYIKQIFVLTHNVYFHKEVSYNPKRKKVALSEETFWIVRKADLLSTKLIKHDSNPIKTSYELLWQDVKAPSNSSLTIQNTLRRILENYFKILGGINLDDICKQFDGKNKLLCKSLLSWLHDGSHSVHDDLYISNCDTTVETYLMIFKEIFEKSKHIAHYKMMMGENFEEEAVA